MMRTTGLLFTISLLAAACGDDTGAAGSAGNGGAGGEGPSTSATSGSGGDPSTSATTGGEGGQGSTTTGSGTTGSGTTATSTSTGGEPGTPCEAWAQAIASVSEEIGCPSQITPGLCADFENLTTCAPEGDAYAQCEAASTTVANCYCEGGGTASDDFACNPSCEDESAAFGVCQATKF